MRINIVGGFTLIELMIVVAILGILIRMAYPRMETFIAKARQAEAQLNLAMIHKLQESYVMDNDTYFVGTSTLKHGDKYGYSSGGATSCPRNKLGFTVTDCDELRYGYTLGATAGDFVAVAHAQSDGSRWLYPRCTGQKQQGGTAIASKAPPCSSPGDGATAVSYTGTWNRGDAWCSDPSKQMNNFIPIIEHCK